MVNYWYCGSVDIYNAKKVVKKLVKALFIDVKVAFDHISKIQLLIFMINLGINIDLVI